MKSHQRLMIFLLLVLALTCVISPWLALGADWFGTRWPGGQFERVPFSRIFNRAFMIAAIMLFFLCRRFLRIGKFAELGVVGLPAGGRDLLTGLTLAVGSMVLLAMAMTAAHVFTPYFRVSFRPALARCASALAAGAFAGCLEEIFFRAILFKGLLKDGRPLRAFFLANLFYSVLHFVKPGEAYFLDQFDFWAGFRHLLSTFQPFFEPLPLLPGIFGLFLIGVVLSYAFMRTGNLNLSIGLHAGWIFSLKTMRVFGDFTREDLGWAFGSSDPKIVSGVATWVGILLVGAAVHRLTQGRPHLVPVHSARSTMQ
jgi:membrane protease YdiL (CAAX protease family)